MNKRINTLQALLEYAHRLPWGAERNATAYHHLNAALQGINQDEHADVPSPDHTGDGGQE